MWNLTIAFTLPLISCKLLLHSLTYSLDKGEKSDHFFHLSSSYEVERSGKSVFWVLWGQVNGEVLCLWVINWKFQNRTNGYNEVLWKMAGIPIGTLSLLPSPSRCKPSSTQKRELVSSPGGAGVHHWPVDTQFFHIRSHAAIKGDASIFHRKTAHYGKPCNLDLEEAFWP